MNKQSSLEPIDMAIEEKNQIKLMLYGQTFDLNLDDVKKLAFLSIATLQDHDLGSGK